MENGLKVSLLQLHKNISTWNQCIESLSSKENEFYQNPSLLLLDSINHLQLQIANLNQTLSKSFANSLSILDSMIEHEDKHLDAQIPSFSENQVIVNHFFHEYIKKVSMPYPLDCGCQAQNNKNPKKGAFICAKSNRHYILMIVLKFVNNICYAYDPAEHDINVIQLKQNEWTPLPTTIPDQANPQYEYPKNSKVLALWTDTNDEWTTEFYNATVILNPSDRGGDKSVIRGYYLDFGEGNKQIVPEQFVVSHSEDW